jgi:hypothetical protein
MIPMARYSVEVYPALAFFAAMGWLALRSER